MMLAGYWLARCGVRHGVSAAAPPAALGTNSWKDAYNSFFEAMGDGRTPAQFRNSLKNARDTFDILFDNGRIGWVDREGERRSLSGSFKRIHEEWHHRSDDELEAFVLGLQAGMTETEDPLARLPEARTEGGEHVYISIRRERDPQLRDDALAIHGFDCMGCGFNFEKAYGDLGKGFIEVHHIVPLADAGKSITDPSTDLIVLCSNCHRMVHRKRCLCLSLDELQVHLGISKGSVS